MAPEPSDNPPESPAPCSFYQADGYAADRSVGYLMRRVMTALTQQIDARFGELGLTNAQWLPLFKVAQGHGDTVVELARICDIDAGAMTRLIDRLEGKGLMRRTRSKHDRRVVHLELTDDGRRVADLVPEVLAAALNQRLAGFRTDEVETLIDFLKRMLANGGVRETGTSKAAPLPPVAPKSPTTGATRRETT